MLSAYYVFCYSDALQTNFVIEANIIDTDQTAPKGAVWSGSILFATLATLELKQKRRANDKSWHGDGVGRGKELSMQLAL